MVYHHPAEQPTVNKLPVLRLLLSDSASAKFFRFVPNTILTIASYCTGFAVVVALATGYTPEKPEGDSWLSFVRSLSKRNMMLWGAAIGAVGLVNAVQFTIKKWNENLCPRPEIEEEYTFFRVIDDTPSTTSEAAAERTKFGSRPGVAFVKACGRFMLHPSPRFEAVIERAFNTVGMSFKAFALMHFTVGVEYALTAWTRIFRHSFGGRLGWYEPVDATSRERLYKTVLNTSLVCFTRTHDKDIDEDLKVDVGGHVVINNARLPYDDGNDRTFRKIVIFLNHTTWELEKVVMVHDIKKNDNVTTQITTWGSPKHTENTDFLRISPAESLHQAGLLLAATVSFYTHGIVHWWATAVSAMPAERWPDGVDESTRMTQWTNTQAVMSSCFFIGNSAVRMAELITTNAGNGLPAHGVAPQERDGETPQAAPRGTLIKMKSRNAEGVCIEKPLFAVLGERSTFHQMSAAAGAALHKHFEGKVCDMVIRGIVVASVQHSIEHFLLGELGPVFTDHSQCIALRTDLSGLLHCLVYPGFYITRPFLACRLRYWDDVSQTIYHACVQREEEMVATNAAAREKGEVEPFVPLKTYCKHYLHVGCSV